MYNHAVAHAYRALGHEVTVVARRNDQTTPAFAETDGIRVHRLLTRDHYYWRRAPVATADRHGPGHELRRATLQDFREACDDGRRPRIAHAAASIAGSSAGTAHL